MSQKQQDCQVVFPGRGDRPCEEADALELIERSSRFQPDMCRLFWL